MEREKREEASQCSLELLVMSRSTQVTLVMQATAFHSVALSRFHICLSLILHIDGVSCNPQEAPEFEPEKTKHRITRVNKIRFWLLVRGVEHFGSFFLVIFSVSGSFCVTLWLGQMQESVTASFGFERPVDYTWSTLQCLIFTSKMFVIQV